MSIDLLRRRMMAKPSKKIIGIEFYTGSTTSYFTLYNNTLMDNQSAIMTVQQLISSGNGNPLLLSASSTHSTTNNKGAVFFYGVDRPNNGILIRCGGTWELAKAIPTPNDIISLIINKNELKIQLNSIDAAVKDISNYASDFGTSIVSILGCGARNSIFYDFKIIDDISGEEISHIVPMMDGDTPILYDIVLNEKIEIPNTYTLTPIFK